jgi:Holliday junction resolvase RusA-like endonuclease
VISFTVYGTPAPAGSKKGFYNRKAGRVIITDDSKRSRPWKAQISDAAAEAMDGAPLLDGALALSLTFVVARPKGHFGSGRNAGMVKGSAPRFPTVKPDLLKLARAVEDALSGIVYRDDAQIVAETLEKEYGEPARVEVRVRRINDLFDTTERRAA